MTSYKPLVLGIGLMLTACHPDKNKLIDPDELRFNSTDASELFFQNVRKSDYYIEEMKPSGMDLYRLRTFQSLEPMNVNPLLILNWRNDQVYFMLRVDTLSSEEVQVSVVGKDEIGISLHDASPVQQSKFSALIYNSILTGGQVTVQDGEKTVPLFPSEDHKIAFRKMYFDYLRLSEVR